jgi:hypothetical protein
MRPSTTSSTACRARRVKIVFAEADGDWGLVQGVRDGICDAQASAVLETA